MIKKTTMLVITFHTTTDAMAMEAACKALGAPGRLIPVPRSISAGCGLAWCTPPDSEMLLRQLMETRHLHHQEMLLCTI